MPDSQHCRLYVWRFSEDSASILGSKHIFGNITVLERLRPSKWSTDLLFVGTDRNEYFSMVWNASREELEPVQELHDKGEPFVKNSQLSQKCVTDPTGKFMALHICEGIVNLGRLVDRGESRHTLKILEQVRISELLLKDWTFLHTLGGPQLAILHQTRNDFEDAKLVVYRVTSNEPSFSIPHAATTLA